MEARQKGAERESSRRAGVQGWVVTQTESCAPMGLKQCHTASMQSLRVKAFGHKIAAVAERSGGQHTQVWKIQSGPSLWSLSSPVFSPARPEVV